MTHSVFFCHPEKGYNSNLNLRVNVYAHGQLENELGYDICAFPGNVPQGVSTAHLFTHDRKIPVVLFGYLGDFDRPQGLVVYAHDAEAMKFASDKLVEHLTTGNWVDL